MTRGEMLVCCALAAKDEAGETVAWDYTKWLTEQINQKHAPLFAIVLACEFILHQAQRGAEEWLEATRRGTATVQ